MLPTAPKLLLKDARDPQEAAAAREAEQQIRQAVAAGDGSGSSTCGVLYNREVVVATKQQAANPHNLLKLLNGGMLPYTFDKKVGLAGPLRGGSLEMIAAVQSKPLGQRHGAALSSQSRCPIRKRVLVLCTYPRNQYSTPSHLVPMVHCYGHRFCWFGIECRHSL